LQKYEKIAFLKFFITYFLSVAILILVAGYFYFAQIKETLLKAEEFSLIKYARHLKMQDNTNQFSKEYGYNFTKNSPKHIDIRNFTIAKDEFSKFIPINHNNNYLQVHKTKTHFNNKILKVKEKIILTQIFLLFLFAYISYILAKNALKPLQESNSKLDKFAKDLIHDLNTPVTSIKLNLKLLEKNNALQGLKPLLRLKKSVHDISELHENLTLLLQEETFQVQKINIYDIAYDVMQTHKQIYPNLSFDTQCKNFYANVNKNAIKQILQNIISNACKYNSTNGFVKIYTKENSLFIKDNGKGIKEVDKIFNRLYSGEHSSGIGLDIVKRLAQAMEIEIDVKTSTNGSIFILTFR